MRLLTTERELREFEGSALVPTMGALHEGHASLIRQAAATGAPTVVTVFVNPTQFGPKDDFGRYPRTLEADTAVAASAGAHALFAPSAELVYPAGMAAAAHEASAWPVPDVGRRPQLEDAWRPGHFGGVCQVVARLLDLARPRIAIFGQKDYQQLRVLEEMVKLSGGRWGALEVRSGPTVREPDGLAMSSRNRYMRGEQREQALGLRRALQAAAAQESPPHAERAMASILQDHGLEVEYAVARDPRSLLPIQTLDLPARALIAARLDTVRLIDNDLIPARVPAAAAAGAARAGDKDAAAIG